MAVDRWLTSVVRYRLSRLRARRPGLSSAVYRGPLSPPGLCHPCRFLSVSWRVSWSRKKKHIYERHGRQIGRKNSHSEFSWWRKFLVLESLSSRLYLYTIVVVIQNSFKRHFRVQVEWNDVRVHLTKHFCPYFFYSHLTRHSITTM